MCICNNIQINIYKTNKHVRKWLKARISYSYYQDYLRNKKDRHDLTNIDLLFISNFKGGSAAIREDPVTLKNKLEEYSEKLKAIDNKKYTSKIINTFSECELDEWKNDGYDFLKLAKCPASKIDGFGPSFTSALLNAHFPDLFPIIDRRVLSGSNILSNSNLKDIKIDSNGQVKELEKYYKELMDFFYGKLKNDNPTTIECILLVNQNLV